MTDIEKIGISNSQNLSDTIFKALVRAQKAFGPALKTSLNPHFKSRYADLSACVEAVIDALNDNGIMLTQHIHEVESGVCVETVFIHESGQVLSCGRLHLPASKQDAQGYGSALSYARRYSLMAAAGIAPEEDDGNAAVAAGTKPQKIEPGALKGTAKATTTYYNLETMEGEKLTAAEHYLLCNSGKRISQTIWKSPIKLEKLAKYVDEDYRETE